MYTTVRFAGQNSAGVGSHGERGETVVANKESQLLAALPFPDPQATIPAGGDDAIRTSEKCKAGNVIVVCVEGVHERLGSQIPYVDVAVDAAGRKELPIGREC